MMRRRKNHNSRRRKQKMFQAAGDAAKKYKALIEIGIGLVTRWATADEIAPGHLDLLAALVAFTDASYASDKARTAKTKSVALALRSAYLIGKHDGRLANATEPENEPTPEK